MDLEDKGLHMRLLMRDRDGKHPALFDDILADVASRSSSAESASGA
ncbi:hypothetical protein AB0G02_29185 [Actinosynnema sp. NPDC023658]